MGVEASGEPNLWSHSYEGYDDDDIPLSVRQFRLVNSETSSSKFDGSVKKRPTKRPFFSTLVKKSKSKVSSFDDDEDIPISQRIKRSATSARETFPNITKFASTAEGQMKKQVDEQGQKKSKSKVSLYNEDEDEDEEEEDDLIPISQRVKRLATSSHKSFPKIAKSASTLEGQVKKQVDEEGQKKRDIEEEPSKELENKKRHLGCVRRINKVHEKIQRKIEECFKDLMTNEAMLNLMEGLIRQCELELKMEKIELHQVKDNIDKDSEREDFKSKEKQLGCIRTKHQVHKKMITKTEECVKDLVITLFSLMEDLFREQQGLGIKSKEVELHQVKEDIDKDHERKQEENEAALLRKITECTTEIQTNKKDLDVIKKKIDEQAKELVSQRKKLLKVMSTKADQHAQMTDAELMKKQSEGQTKELESEEKKCERRVKELKSKEKHFDGRVKKLELKEKQLEVRVKEFELKEEEFAGQVKIELKKKHFESQVKELESKVEQLEGKMKDLESKKEEFEGQLKEQEPKKQHFERRVKELESKEKQLERRVKEFESKEEEFENKMEELNLKKKDFESRVKELKSKEQQLEDRVKKFESKEEEFEDQMKELKSKEKQLEGQMEDFESKKEEFEDQVKELESKEKQFVGRVNELEFKDIKFEVKVKELKSKEKQFQGKYKELEFKDKQFEEKLKELKSKEKQFKAQVKDLESKRNKFDEQLKELDLIEKQYEVIIKSFEEGKELDNQLNPTIDGTSVQFLPSEKTDERESLDNEILDDLKTTLDPSKVVLDIIQKPIVPQFKNGDNAVIMDSSHIFLLEQLLIISPQIKPCVREEAMKLALDLKANMRISAENSMEVLSFLLLLSIYGLVPSFDEDEVLKLFEFAAEHKQAVELFQRLGFEDKISEFVQNLINKKQYIEAVRFICAYNLVDKNQPVDLLRECMQNAKQISEISCQNTNSLEIKDKAKDQEIATLTNVLECISDINLKSEDLLDEIDDRILELNKQKVSSICSGTRAILQKCKNIKERNVVTKTC